MDDELLDVVLVDEVLLELEPDDELVDEPDDDPDDELVDALEDEPERESVR